MEVLKIWAAVIGATFIIVFGALASINAAQAAYQRGLDEGASRATKVDLAAQFDKGMGAGVEYERWFCQNPGYAAD